MYYLYPVDDTFTIFHERPDLPGIIELEKLPPGTGVLRRKEGGTFYYEPFPEEIDPPVIEPPETLEEKIAKLTTTMEQNNLITVDAVLGVYEELVALREEVAALKGTSNNA